MTKKWDQAAEDLVEFIRESECMDHEMDRVTLNRDIQWYWLDDIWADAFSSSIMYNPLSGI
jgi:hypothetical protein